MTRWTDELGSDLQDRDAQRLRRRMKSVVPEGRTVRCGGRDLVNLSSNDYLGLAQHPRLKAAAKAAIEAFGVGSGASRLAGGHLPCHEQVEQRFARFKQSEAALFFPCGYMANLAVLSTLARTGDLICVDRLNHASLLDAARASHAQVRAYPHLDYGRLERLLERDRQRAAARGPDPADRGLPRVFIVTDSVFSMDGDVADLARLGRIADRFGAVTVVDEAHATGVLGSSGAGLIEAQNLCGRFDIVVSTASKALGGLGGLVTAERPVIDMLVNRARCFIYTTAVPPAQAAVVLEALAVLQDEPWRRTRLISLCRQFERHLAASGWLKPRPVATPIFPLITGSPASALLLGEHLAAAGFLAAAIRPPTVKAGTSRVRLSLRADLDPTDIDRLGQVLAAWTMVHPPGTADRAGPALSSG